jgi:uncharacterized protein (TIGR02246 family)
VPAFSADRSQDEAAIHNVEKGLQEAWNRHDGQAFASFFTRDADCMNVVGWWWKGHPQIEKKVAEAHVFMFRDSILTNNEIHIRFLSSRMAVVHVRWSMVGNRKPDGTVASPERAFRRTSCKSRQGDG